MKTIFEDEIEILGEDGNRLVATFPLDKAVLRLRLINDGSGRTVLLDAEEATKLAEFLEDRIPQLDAKTGALKFATAAGDTVISFYPDNMGEPFREGISISLRPNEDHGTHVFMETREAQRLQRFVAENLVQVLLPGLKP
jgi:hypothetical protein